MMTRRTKLYLEIVFGCLVFFALSCLGQNTGTITGTVTDTPDAVAWANGSWAATLYNPRGGTPHYINNGQLVAPLQYPTTALSTIGTFSISGFPLNSAIAPAGTQWIFTFCPNAITGCVTLNPVSINQGGDITSIIANFIKSPRFPAAGANQFGYADSEIEPLPVPGGFYYNVTLSCQRVWSGTAWSCGAGGGGGGGGIPGGLSGQVQYNLSGAFSGTPQAIVNPTTFGIDMPVTTGAYSVVANGAVCNGTADDAPAINALIQLHPNSTYQLPPGTCHLSESIQLGNGNLVGAGGDWTASSTNLVGSTLLVDKGVTGIVAAGRNRIANIAIVGSEPASQTDSSTFVFPAPSCIDAQQYKLPIVSYSVTGGVLTLGFGTIPAFYKAGGILTIQGMPATNANLNGTFYVATANNTYVASMTINVPGASPVASTTPAFTTNATGTAGTNTITVASTAGIALGMYVTGDPHTGNGLPYLANTYVTGISGTTITLSKNLYIADTNNPTQFQPVLRVSSAGSCSAGVQLTGGAVNIYNVSVTNFGLAGVEINGETPNISDSSVISGLNVFNNRFAGLFAHGEDAHANVITGGLYYKNGFSGIVDFGFLGSAYTQPTISYNYGGLNNISVWPGEGTPLTGCTLTRANANSIGQYQVTVTGTGCTPPSNMVIGSQVAVHGATDQTFNSPTSPITSGGYVISLSPFIYVQPGYGLSATSTTGNISIASMQEALVGFGLNGGSIIVALNNTLSYTTINRGYTELAQGQLNAGGCSEQGNFSTYNINPDYGDCQDPNFKTTTLNASVLNGAVLSSNSVSFDLAQYNMTLPAPPPASAAAGGSSNTYLSCPAGTGSPPSSTCVWAAGGTGGGGGGGTITGSGTANVITQWTAGTAIGNSPLSISNSTLVDTDTNGISTPQLTVGASGSISQQVITYFANATSTGTVASTLSKIVGTTAVQTTTSDTGIAVFPTLASFSSNGSNVCAAGIAGQACLVLMVPGTQATLFFDSGGATSGHFVGASTTTAGYAKDLGTSITAGVYCVGQVTANVSGSTTGIVALRVCPPGS